MARFYEQFLSLGEFAPDVAWSSTKAAEEEVARLTSNVKQCLWAAQIPRRLGPVSGAALRADKLALRRLAHGQETCRILWCRSINLEPDVTTETSPDQKREGAQMDVQISAAAWQAGVRARMARNLAAGHSLGMTSWCNMVANIYLREIETYDRVLNATTPGP